MIRDNVQVELFVRSNHPGDAMCEKIVSSNANMIIPWFLMACVAYDRYDDPILSDAYFDELSDRMAEQWDTIEHFHKHLIIMPDDRTQFKGSSTAIRAVELPERLLGGTRDVIRTLEESRINRKRGR